MLPDFRIRQRDYLLEIARAMSQELNLDKLLARIVHISAEMLAGQAGLIALRREKGGWGVATAHGIPASFLRYLNVLMAQVQPHEDPTRFELPEINQLLQEITRSTSLGLLVGVGLPLIAFERLIGVIYIFRGYLDIFSANDRALLQSFADQAAIAVHNAQLYTQVSQEKKRMDALLDTVADGMLILAPSHVVERCNPALEHMLGIQKEKIIGSHHEEIIRWKKHNQGMTLEQAEAGGWPLVPNAILYVEGDLERANGSSLPVGITYAPLLSSEGALLNTIATVRDITHFRELEEIKSTFVSVISHELKTPVALIKGYVATLRRDDASWNQDVVKDSLQVIEEEADRLAIMIENLLDATRLQAGGLKLNLADLSLDVLARRIVERFRTQSDRHIFVVDFPEAYPSILGDEDRLTQVFSNLISNAIKYSPEGGEIRISGQERPEELVVCVSDQGPGIAPGDLPYIFDRFYRASDASRTTKGAGLGLYLTRALIEAHGGHIWVDSRYSGGARVCFSFPR
jgi:PAS domain S-box-containing protein